MRRPPARSYYKQSRLKQLRAFCNAAQTGSVSAAAERMHLSQPAVSLLIRALESELAARLFERRGPRIRLTGEGRLLLELAEPLLDAMDALPAAFAERCGKPTSGQIAIAAGESSTLYLLPPIVREFADHYPEIRYKLHNVTGNNAIGLLRSGEVDFGVGPLPQIPEDIEYRPLFEYRPMLITPPGHPLARGRPSLQAIAAYGLVLPPRHLNTWRIVEVVLQEHGVSYDVVLEAGGWEVIKEYVQAGLGVSIVTSICLRGDEPLAAVPLDRYFPRRSYGLIRRRGKLLSPAAQRFVDILVRHGTLREGAQGPPLPADDRAARGAPSGV